MRNELFFTEINSTIFMKLSIICLSSVAATPGPFFNTETKNNKEG